jgi:hypothetical protein
MRRTLVAIAFVLLAASAFAQSPYGLLPIPRQCFTDANGNPLSGGLLYSYQAGTTTPLATYSDSSGLYQNQNPVQLDSSGCWSIWLAAARYKITLKNSSGNQLWSVDNVSNLGALIYNQAVLLNPASGAEQDVAGPVGATYFVGKTAHTTSPGVRVSLLDPTFTLDTAVHPPTVTVTNPAAASQNYVIPDPVNDHAAFVLSPGATDNTLDCTATGLTCKRTAYAYFEGGGCNNATAGLGWDNFPTNSPVPVCVTGTNVQKGVMALPSAATKAQEKSGSGACATTCTLTYPAATSAGDGLVLVIAADTSRTVSSVSDGTNAYSLAIAKTSGTFDLEVWYFNGNSTAMAAGSTLTITLSGNGNAAFDWFAYKDLKIASVLDVTASANGTGTAVTTGTTAGTAQNTELILAAFGASGNPTATPGNGTVAHSTVSQSTNVTVGSSGMIQQATSTQAGTFTLSASSTWAGVIVAFKAQVASSIVAQRQFRLPSTYLSAIPMNADIVWQAPAAPTGTVNVKLGAQVACTAPGSTDDPTFNTVASATALVNATSANVITDTPLNAITTTGCAAGNFLHYQVLRQRYDAADTYEGYVYVNGAGLVFGTNQ